jgi:hydrogenase maturation protease
MDEVRRIADAVLYEGYVLWPYRRSAMKNQQRWTFGGVFPEAYSAQRKDDPAEMRSECLLEGDAVSSIEASVRFLHVVERQAYRGDEPVDELEAAGERHLSWDEATERELSTGPLRVGDIASAHELAVDVPEGSRREELDGGAIVRSWRALRGSVEVVAEPLRDGLFRVGVRIRNATPWNGASREETLRQTFCSTHAVLRTDTAAFVSLTDPPDELRDAAARCENAGAWPVLVGNDGDRSTVLCSPIILSDYPQVAPESPGDFFDGGEIDQMLVLNILALTDDEKREMRDADPRTREILERTEAMSEEELMRLHGAIREFGMVRRT